MEIINAKLSFADKVSKNVSYSVELFIFVDSMS